jgi:hypothetical protein
MKDEYDFSAGVRGKYTAQLAQGSNIVVLAPDVADFFKTAKAVNDALRSKMNEKHSRPRRAARRPARRG